MMLTNFLILISIFSRSSGKLGGYRPTNWRFCPTH